MNDVQYNICYTGYVYRNIKASSKKVIICSPYIQC